VQNPFLKNIRSFFFSLPRSGISILCMFLSFNFSFYQPLPLFLDFFAIQFKRFNKVVSDLVCKPQAKLKCNFFLVKELGLGFIQV
jgi:hypothetical protein